MSYKCASPNCPGYPYKASDVAHPADTCGSFRWLGATGTGVRALRTVDAGDVRNNRTIRDAFERVLLARAGTRLNEGATYEFLEALRVQLQAWLARVESDIGVVGAAVTGDAITDPESDDMPTADQVADLDTQLRSLAGELWEQHPNNPKNKGKL